MFPRRSRNERTIIAIVFAVVVFLIWTQFDDLTTQIALTAVAVLVAAGRRGGRVRPSRPRR